MSDVKKCPHCGKQLHSNALYCMFCMTSLQPKKNITPNIHKRKKRAAIGVILLVPGILLVLVLLFSKCSAQTSRQDKPALEDVLSAGNAAETYGAGSVEQQLSDADENGTETTMELLSQEENADSPEKQTERTEIETESDIAQIESPVQPEQSCQHQYMAANCITPMTCSICGNSVGTVNASAHTWDPVTKVIHHDEVGHYENEEVQYQKTVYLCFFCGYDQDGYDSLDALREHISVHSSAHNYDVIVSRPDMLADTRQVWATKYEQHWVVDQEAYDETVIVGYTCLLCKCQKEP